MSQRYYCPLDSFDEPFWLTDSEAHHLLNVMRIKAAAQVEVFDGRGRVATAEVVETAKKKALLRPLPESVRVETATDQTTVTLATAVPKSDRFRWLVEKATELGVSRLVPLKTTRSVVSPRESKLDKQQQYVIEACKQSGRNTLMEIGALVDLDQAVDELSEGSLLLWGALPTDGQSSFSLADLTTTAAKQIVILVGPEGGFTPEEEMFLADRGANRLSVGRHTLRTETAGIVLSSVVLSALAGQ